MNITQSHSTNLHAHFMSAKHWVFTLNNYTDEEEAAIGGVEPGNDLVYLICGREVGTSGTPHLQGYLQLATKRRRRGITGILPCLSRAFLEIARGSPEENRRYCSKENNILREVGVPSTGQGQRRDLESIKQSIDEGVCELKIAEEHFQTWCQYRKSFEAYRALKRPKRNRDEGVSVFVYVGPTGTGKTRSVFDSEADLWVYSGTGMWFDGFCGQEAVLFDDFDGSQLPYRYLLQLTDRYPMSVPIKGGFTDWTPKRIYFTSNVKPNIWYGEDLAPLQRRITEVREFVNASD